MDNKAKKCIFIGYKYGIKGYKLWNLLTKNIVYSQDVVFREVKDVPKHEVLPKEKELETIKFELEGEKSDLTKKHGLEEEEESHTSSVFHSSFSLYITNIDPNKFGEAMDLEDGKL
jgi:hypothetical protein